MVVTVAAALTDEERDQTFQDEDPGPSVKSSKSVHFCDAASEETAESSGCCGR
jgi:hypothetical protein